MTLAQTYLHTALSVLRRDFKLFMSYRGVLVSQVFAMFFSLALFYYVSRLVKFGSFNTPDKYYAFVVIGMVIMTVLHSTLSIAMTLRQELVAGTFERFVISPFGAIAGLISMLLFPFFQAVIQAVLTLAVGTLVFGLPVHWATVPLAIPVAMLGALAFGSIGLLFASIILVFKQAMSGTAFVTSAIAIVAGVYFPVSLLPGWVQWMSDVQPFTPAVDLMRHLLVQTPLREDIWLSVAKLVGFSAILIPVAVVTARAAIVRGQRKGTIIEY